MARPVPGTDIHYPRMAEPRSRDSTGFSDQPGVASMENCFHAITLFDRQPALKPQLHVSTVAYTYMYCEQPGPCHCSHDRHQDRPLGFLMHNAELPMVIEFLLPATRSGEYSVDENE